MKNIICVIAFSMSLYLPEAAFSQGIQGTYAIKNSETGMLLRIKDAQRSNGTPLVAYPAVNWKCVTWDFKHVDGQYYQLENLFTGKTFQAIDPTTGSALQQQALVAKQSNQQYEFIPVGKDHFLIRLKGTDLYLTPSDANGDINSTIILANKDGGRLQQWTIYEQNPTM